MKALLLFIFIVSYSIILAQDTNYVDPNYKSEKQKDNRQKKDLGQRVYYGGTFGMQFGSYTSILVEPLVGFRMTEKLSTGVGIGLRYGKDNRQNFEYTNYIGRFFARYLLVPQLFAHIEYMAESYDSSFGDYYLDFNTEKRTVVPFLFVGGGFRSQAGNGSLIVQVLFNVIQNNTLSKTIYPSGSPYISIGYISGF